MKLGEGVDPAVGVRTPLSESASVGAAVGMALAGKPVTVELVEIAGLVRVLDLLGDVSRIRERSGGAWSVPVVIRVPITSRDTVPVLPAGARLVISAGEGAAESVWPGEDPTVLLVAEGDTGPGKVGPVVRRAGDRVTLLAYGAGVAAGLAAAEASGVSVEVIDLQGVEVVGLAVESVRRTGRVVVIGHGDPRVVTQVLQGAFWQLEARPAELSAADPVEDMKRAIHAVTED